LPSCGVWKTLRLRLPFVALSLQKKNAARFSKNV